MPTPIVFTQAQIDEMARKPFDVYDNKIRQNMDAFQVRIDEIQERNAAREASLKKWKKDDQAS